MKKASFCPKLAPEISLSPTDEAVTSDNALAGSSLGWRKKVSRSSPAAQSLAGGCSGALRYLQHEALGFGVGAVVVFCLFYFPFSEYCRMKFGLGCGYNKTEPCCRH